MFESPSTPRNLFMVLGTNSLGYSELCIESLFRNIAEPVSLTLITDRADDRSRISDKLSLMSIPDIHLWKVVAQAEVDVRADSLFRDFPNLREFRRGHPCWRKITDPVLMADPGAEVVLLDPDVYFPNRFRFEPTDPTGLHLMWQPPHCLLPDATVERAFAILVRLAHHTDIGVCQFRNALDLAWIDDFIGRLGGPAIPRAMHVESIIWAALALRMGGGYLSPTNWYCWRNRQWKRLIRACGMRGESLLSIESFASMKCFHAGGPAKWWLHAFKDKGMFGPPNDLTASTPILPFQELTPKTYRRGRFFKRLVRLTGYYSVFQRRSPKSASS